MLCPNRSTLAGFLESRDIDSRPLLVGNLARQPFTDVEYDGLALRSGDVPRARRSIVGDFPMADRVFDEGLWVGVHPRLTVNDLERIVDVVRRFYALGEARTGTEA